MTYEEYKQDLYAELGRQLEGTSKKLVIFFEGTANEEIAVELPGESMCSQSLSLWYLYEQRGEYNLSEQVPDICGYFERLQQIEEVEKLEHVTIWAANLEKVAEKLEESGTPYMAVGDIAVYPKFYEEVYDAYKEDEVWPYDYIRPVRSAQLEQWGLTVQELYEKVKHYDINECFQTVLDISGDAVHRTLGPFVDLLPDTDGFYGISGINGIGMMFYPDGLYEIAQHLGGDLFVMPFSNDRILACSKKEHDLKDLQEVVKKVYEENKKYGQNPLHVSSMVYQFDANKLMLQPAATLAEKKVRHTVR